MWAIQLNADGYVTNFQHTTLLEFSRSPRYKSDDPTAPTWVFIDRANTFWDDDEIRYFLQHPSEFYYVPEDQCLLRDYKDPDDGSPLV